MTPALAETSNLLRQTTRRYHLVFAWLVAAIFPLWSFFDFLAVHRIWMAMAIVRLLGALIVLAAGLLCTRGQLSPTALGYVFTIVLYVFVGVPLSLLREDEVNLWCVGYTTCFITCASFQFWETRHHFINLAIGFLCVAASFAVFRSSSVSLNLTSGLFTVGSVALASTILFLSKMLFVRKNIELVTELRAVNEALETSNCASAKLNGELSNARSELIQREKLATLGMLASGVAHQLGNTLNVVSTSLLAIDNLQKQLGIADERIRSCAHRAKKAISLSKDIIDSMSSVGKANDVFRENNLHRLVESGVVLVKGKALERVRIRNDVDQTIQLVCSRSGVTQIFMNLFSNAVDAITHSSGLVTIAARVEGGDVIIQVSDDGSGIPESVRDRLFEAFVTSKSADEGTGLGLYLVKKEVVRHEGTITFDTSRSGTTFVLTLPLKGLSRG